MFKSPRKNSLMLEVNNWASESLKAARKLAPGIWKRKWKLKAEAVEAVKFL